MPITVPGPALVYLLGDNRRCVRHLGAKPWNGSIEGCESAADDGLPHGDPLDGGGIGIGCFRLWPILQPRANFGVVEKLDQLLDFCRWRRC